MTAPLPGVSYIVTVYNKARYVEGVVRALTAQEGGFEREYVLVDDGSTDGSAEIAARLVAEIPRARLIRQENRGPSVAVNRGLKETSMPFTHIVDGDDVVAPYGTRMLLEAALASGCGAVYGRNDWYRSGSEPHFPEPPAQVTVTPLNDTLYTVIRIGHAGGSTYIVDTALFKRAGGCDERVFVQDHSISQRMALVTKIGIVDHLVCMGPADEPGRIMKNPAQLQHDQSLSALLILRDHPELAHRIRRLVQKQVTGRAWKYAARHNGASVTSRFFWLFLAARLPLVKLGDEMLQSTLAAFRRSDNVRLMPTAVAESVAGASVGAPSALQSAARNRP
ncbi:MAG TPA: glycosyltransferase family 2 protein [Stellaceae bacterium]|nr:glycosyltransferase family 2 protein [Stellaceae bacterium]